VREEVVQTFSPILLVVEEDGNINMEVSNASYVCGKRRKAPPTRVCITGWWAWMSDACMNDPSKSGFSHCGGAVSFCHILFFGYLMQDMEI